jgi:hypothetical protein
MTEDPVDPTTTPVQQASKILTAWSRKDPLGFRRELCSALALCSGGVQRGLEEEQFELLGAIVARLQKEDLNLDSNAVSISRCIDLLSHLATPSPADGASPGPA